MTNEEIYKITDIPAKIDGGMSVLFKEAAKRIKYTNNSGRYPIESKVFVAFIVTESGSVTGQRIIKNIAGTDIGEQLLEINVSAGSPLRDPASQCSNNIVLSLLFTFAR